MGHEIDVESVDLAELAQFLGQRFQDVKPEGFVVGRTELRDSVAERLDCSQLVAECIVDTMVARGILRLEQHEGDTGLWRIIVPTV